MKKRIKIKYQQIYKRQYQLTEKMSLYIKSLKMRTMQLYLYYGI